MAIVRFLQQLRRVYISACGRVDEETLLNRCRNLMMAILLIITALQLFMQSFGLLNQFLPSSSILDKGLPIWHFWLLYIFSNIILPACLWSSCWLSWNGFPGVYSFDHSCFLHSFYMTKPSQALCCNKCYYMLVFIILSNSFLVFIRQIPFSLVGPNIFLKTFLSKTISLLVMVSFSVYISHAYVTAGLITEHYNFNFASLEISLLWNIFLFTKKA